MVCVSFNLFGSGFGRLEIGDGSVEAPASATGAALDALLHAILDRAFKGELA
jgi:hypothetical protein